MAEQPDIAASSGQVAQFGLRVSKSLCSYSSAISNADGRIQDLAKDVELTSAVFQDAARLFDDPETAAVRNEDADHTARRLIDSYHDVLENIDGTLEEGHIKRSPWPFKSQNFEILNAELDMKNGGMQLLLLTIQVASRMNDEACPTSNSNGSIRRMEELESALEASSRRLEAFRTEAILTGGSSESESSSERSPVVDPNGSTEFTYIDDSPPSPSQPAPQASAFSSDSSPSVGVNFEGSKVGNTIGNGRRIPSVNLESCIEHVQSVLRQIKETKTCGTDDDTFSPKEARDLMDAYARTQAVLEQIMAGNRSSNRRNQSLQREQSQVSIDASTGLGSSLPPHQKMLKRWRTNMARKVGEDCKNAREWAAITFLWFRSHLQQSARCLRLQRNCNPSIKFVDVLDRRFSFPWRFCCTWKGMEDLIKQAFASEASISQYVYKGYYDLVGPDGAVILPMLWTTMVQPGWTIKMRMHGLDEPTHVSRIPPVIFSDEPWLDFNSNRGRSLKRRGSHSPGIIDVGEGPAGVQVIPQDGLGRRQSICRKARSAPGAGFHRTASITRRPATEMAKRGLSPSRALLIDVSPRPRTRGKSRSGHPRSLSPVPPPPPPPPPPPVRIDSDERPESIRVLSPDFSVSDSDEESSIVRGNLSLLGSIGISGIPRTAEEALRRWTTLFD